MSVVTDSGLWFIDMILFDSGLWFVDMIHYKNSQ